VVVLEENCWLGIHAVVTGSITVGRGSVIAANAVVTRDVPPFCVVAGVPARIIQMFNPGINTWESADNETERERITAIRMQNSLPSRDEYRRILERTRAGDTVDPLVAGRGQCL
jgi:tetrahydrodipicolinate N-succinyltransferase